MDILWQLTCCESPRPTHVRRTGSLSLSQLSCCECARSEPLTRTAKVERLVTSIPLIKDNANEALSDQKFARNLLVSSQDLLNDYYSAPESNSVVTKSHEGFSACIDAPPRNCCRCHSRAVAAVNLAAVMMRAVTARRYMIVIECLRVNAASSIIQETWLELATIRARLKIRMAMKSAIEAWWISSAVDCIGYTTDTWVHSPTETAAWDAELKRMFGSDLAGEAVVGEPAPALKSLDPNNLGRS